MAKEASDNQALTDAFTAFNAHSQQLDDAYRELQGQVAQLTAALSQARSARHDELIEKELLADRLTQVLDALPALVIVLDAQGCIRDCNGLAMQTFSHRMLGEQWLAMSATMFDQPLQVDTECMARNGRWYALSQCALRDGGRIVLLTDVSDAQASRHQTQRQERLAMLGEMAARLAHQIRTPLSAAMLYTSQPDAQQTTDTRSKVLARLQELAAMVDDMLRFAKGTPEAVQCVSSVELLSTVAEQHRALLPDHLKISVAASDYAIRANRTALLGAMNNLVVNAAQHSPVGGTIVLSDDLDDEGRVCLSVTDQGSGVSETLRHQIFEPFFTTRSEGTGLGLAVVQSVAQALQGDVVFDSDESGSRFCIRLPGVTEYEGLPSVGGASQFAISDDASSAQLLRTRYAHG